MKIIDGFRRFFNAVVKSGLKGVKTLAILGIFFATVTPFVYVSLGGNASFTGLVLYQMTSLLTAISIIIAWVLIDIWYSKMVKKGDYVGPS